MDYCGLVILNKPAGCSSHKMVGAARRIFNMKKIGHTGTLDPAATGVLPLLLGKATRASELITAESKRYTARILLGTVTDSLDMDGNILARNAVDVSEAQLREVISGFVGGNMAASAHVQRCFRRGSAALQAGKAGH